jgi:hypothetical protein
VSEVIECLLSKPEALSSSPSTTKNVLVWLLSHGLDLVILRLRLIHVRAFINSTFILCFCNILLCGHNTVCFCNVTYWWKFGLFPVGAITNKVALNTYVVHALV